MQIAHLLEIAGAGTAAGAMNALVGGGSLLTFPVLLAAGLPPVLANVSNTVGIFPGSLSAVSTSGKELKGQRKRLIRLGAASAIGGLTGAAVLLALPSSSFRRVIPVLVLGAVILMMLQPRIKRRLDERSNHPARLRPSQGTWGLFGGIAATGVYGGYFGASQGLIFISLLSTFLDDSLVRLNATKNVMGLIDNAVAAAFFVIFHPIDWTAAGIVAAGSLTGGFIGAHIGRSVNTEILRRAIISVGLVVAAILIVEYR